jgi:hypothetical protein
MPGKNHGESRSPAKVLPAFFGLIEAVLDRFGWPGALVIYGIYFLEKNATQEQKRALIDLYFLGKGINLQYPLVIMGVVFGLAFLAQWGYYHKKMRLQKEEIKRLGEWKTKHQEQKVGAPLHHSVKGES